MSSSRHIPLRLLWAAGGLLCAGHVGADVVTGLNWETPVSGFFALLVTGFLVFEDHP